MRLALDEVAAVELEDASHGGLPLLGLLVVRVELLHRERCRVHVPPHYDLPPRRDPSPPSALVRPSEPPPSPLSAVAAASHATLALCPMSPPPPHFARPPALCPRSGSAIARR
ncbi:Os06g0366166 [Oryza sativa Japonica Group]|uniref:Os06g0366166 protein n=1 Tax=Oryza sativa subsp. japonica TaxID=39947 RepID=A0A0N7KM36_ORYSJ|nr:Os06g0366166 [Oryza sativa Japonica Group]